MSKIYGAKVFINVSVSGLHGGLKAVPAHEIPLLHRRVQMEGESTTLEVDWPVHVPRVHPLPSLEDVDAEYARLHGLYAAEGENGVFDLVADVYGDQQSGGLIKAMQRIYTRYLELVKETDDMLTQKHLEELVALATERNVTPIDTIQVPASAITDDDIVESADPVEVEGLEGFLTGANWSKEDAEQVAKILTAYDDDPELVPGRMWKTVPGVGGNPEKRDALLRTLSDYLAQKV